MFSKRRLKDFIKGPAHILYHVMLILMSAAFALSLPYTVEFVAKKFLIYWTWIGNEKIFLVSVEIALAVILILFFNYIGRSWNDRRYSRMAREAGLVFVSPSKGFFARRRSKRLKEREGIARDVMVIGSTGYRTFADSGGDLHGVIKNCREAKIMLLNPFSDGASIRARSILDPEMTPQHFREQIRKSIDFLKELRAVQKNVRLKLYGEVPFLKVAISGDYVWLKHYHAGFDVQAMPEFVFKHNQSPGSLYVPFYQYFLRWWNNPGIPEYDLDTDELVYRDPAGNEEKREPFQKGDVAAAV
ncbi:MAG: hypothetical protein HZA17_10660 [Nitrospirae bacterium]|nr:hypothetical protein [Nitrospirota bacterium]